MSSTVFQTEACSAKRPSWGLPSPMHPRSAVSFTNLSATLGGWQGEAGLAAAESWAASLEGLRREDLAGARRSLAGLRARLASEPAFPRWRLDDLDRLLARLERRFWLAEAGLIPASELD